MIRSLCSGSPRTKAPSRSRIRWGFWLVVYSVYSSVAGSKFAMAARGSIALGTRRLLTTSIETTCAAPSKAASVAALVADFPVVADVARCLVEDLRRPVGLGRLDRGHRRKLLVVHVDQIGRRLGLLLRLGDDDRHAVTRVTHLADRQRRMRRLDHRRAVLAVDQPPRRDAAHAFHVLAREHRVDPRRRHRRAGVDPADVGVRDRRAEDVPVQLPGQIDVVGVAASPGEEALVFLPLDRCADP